MFHDRFARENERGELIFEFADELEFLEGDFVGFGIAFEDVDGERVALAGETETLRLNFVRLGVGRNRDRHEAGKVGDGKIKRVGDLHFERAVEMHGLLRREATWRKCKGHFLHGLRGGDRDGEVGEWRCIRSEFNGANNEELLARRVYANAPIAEVLARDMSDFAIAAQRQRQLLQSALENLRFDLARLGHGLRLNLNPGLRLHGVNELCFLFLWRLGFEFPLEDKASLVLVCLPRKGEALDRGGWRGAQRESAEEKAEEWSFHSWFRKGDRSARGASRLNRRGAMNAEKTKGRVPLAVIAPRRFTSRWLLPTLRR